MRPYLAILKDSFREAMVSRVLWVLLVLATFVLALILPLSLTEEVAYQIEAGHVHDATALARKIKAEHDGDRPAPGKQIWPLLRGETKQRFEDASPEDVDENPPLAVETLERNEDGHFISPFTADLNEILRERDLWDEAAWEDINLTPETKELLDRGPNRLDDVKLGRLNRLLLEAAYPQHVASSRRTSLLVTYFGIGPGVPLPLTLDGTVQYWLSLLTEYVAGVAGVIIAIFVTSSIIPHTFEAGSIDLLLSKPVSRPLVFLTKFSGGCAFILLLSAYFIVGMWLVTGLRFGYWSGSIFKCIPVLMFLFAIYYSVSALAGLIWRNAIVAVVISVVFWGACWSVRFVKINISDSLILAPLKISQIIDTPDGVYAYREGFFSFGTPDHWNAHQQQWESQSELGLPKRSPLGASVYLPDFQGGGRRYFAVGENRFIEVRHDGAYESDEIDVESASPFGPPTRSPAKIEEVHEQPEDAKRPGGDGQPDGGVGPGPRRVSGQLSLASSFVAAMDSSKGDLIVYDGEQLRRLVRSDSGNYDEAGSVEVSNRITGVVAMGGSTVLLASAEGQIQLYDAETLEPRGEAFQPENKSPPYSAHSSADGRYFAVLFHHGVLWLYDTQNEETVGGVSAQGEIVAVTFSGDDQFLVAHHFNEVTQYQLDSMKQIDPIRPELSGFSRVYWYGIRPVYNVFPKPGELGDLVTYLVSDSKSTSVIGSDNLQSRAGRGKLNIWQPLWTNIAYLVGLLGLGCWYVQRKDF